MGSLESIQLTITELKSSSVKLDAEFKNVKNEFHQLEINVSSLGDVFDSVKDVDTNKKEVEKIKKSVEQCSINQRATEAFAPDLQKMKDASAFSGGISHRPQSQIHAGQPGIHGDSGGERRRYRGLNSKPDPAEIQARLSDIVRAGA